MRKKQLHHLYRYLRKIHYAYFLAIALLSSIIAISALRANNEHMIKLRDAVYLADKNGSGVQSALQTLQLYVVSHMNTNLSAGPNPVYPPIQLKYTYDRLVQVQSDALAQSNTQLYTAAQQYCEQQDPTDFSGHNRVPCIEQYVQSHDAAQLPTIPDALYKFDFISPKWSPDLAGWSIVNATIFGLLTIAVFTVRTLVKRRLK